MRASALLVPLAAGALALATAAPAGADPSAPAPSPQSFPLNIVASPGHAAPGAEITLSVHGDNVPAALTGLRVCSVSLRYGMHRQPEGPAEDFPDKDQAPDSPYRVSTLIPADAPRSTADTPSRYWFWLSTTECPAKQSLSRAPGQVSNRALVRVDALPAVVPPAVAPPAVVPPAVTPVVETRVLGERFTRSAPVPAEVAALVPSTAVAAAPAAVAVSRAAAFTG